jgi:hypothetical protein
VHGAHSGNFLSDAFAFDAKRGRPKLREIANAVALEFRLAEELLADEREEGCMFLRIRSGRAEADGVTRVVPLGDAIVKQSIDGVLEVISESALLTWFEGSYARNDQSPTRQVYGYADAVFSEWGMRPAERTLVCLASDVWFNPYACGFWEATSSTRTDPRIDLRSAMNLIWTWGTFDHRPLAYALAAARRHPDGTWMPFEPFTKLYRRVLQLHWDDDDTCARVAEFLSSFTIERLQFVKPGRSGKLHLYAPALSALRTHEDAAIRVDLADAPADPIEAFVRGAGPLCREVFLHRLAPNEAVRAQRALLDGTSALVSESCDG